MNRLHHVRLTIPANIEDNSDYDNFEYILLDYNSSDGLEDWVKDEMAPHLKSGRLKYYRTEEPKFFDRTHSRNLVFKLAEGEVLCNMDADNFTGKGYATYINEEFNKDREIFIVADTKKRFYFLRNAFGRFCCSKEAYLNIRGMDESMGSYGCETLDLYERLELLGLKEVVIKNINFLRAISHTDEERVENEFFLKNIDQFFIRFHSHEKSEILLLFKDNSYEHCTIIPEKVDTHLPAALLEDTLKKGNWLQDNNILNLSNDKSVYSIVGNCLLKNGDVVKPYYKIEAKHFLKRVAKDYSFIMNTKKLQKHRNEKCIKVNPKSFGSGKVTFNFNQVITTV